MNVLPIDWSEQIQAVYPQRSGPSGWRGMRLMLALRRALFDSSWEQIIDGCKNYAKYAQTSGIEGSSFVQAPLRFIQDGCYLETFEYKAPEDPKVIEARNKEADRWRRAREAAGKLDPALAPYPLESVAAFETRVALEATRQPSHRNGLSRSAAEPDARMAGLGRSISSLTDRMRMTK